MGQSSQDHLCGSSPVLLMEPRQCFKNLHPINLALLFLLEDGGGVLLQNTFHQTVLYPRRQNSSQLLQIPHVWITE